MLFPTVEFAAFFAAVLMVNWWLMPRPRLWKPFILVASYVCYGWASPKLVLVLIGVTLWNQAFGWLVFRTRRRTLLITGIAGDIALLGYAKYAGFFAHEIDAALNRIGLGAPLPVIVLVATIGVSFYTFQGISYLVDLWRGDLARPAPTLDFLVYQAFFPHLFAGPIVRARELIPQFAEPRDPAQVPYTRAGTLIVAGLAKKLVIADTLGKLVVDPVFAAPDQHAAYEVLFAIYAYAAQIYADFSGYTDIAIGLALLLGFRFPVNFDRPYSSASLREFWRRWHISLSSWLRDYVYIPLGGGRSRSRRNLFLTMLLGGLWHGANWTFVAWGGLHGAALAVERRTGPARRPWLGRLITFHFVALCWVFFRAPGFSDAFAVLGRLTAWTAHGTGLVAPLLVVLVLAGTAIQLVPPGFLTRPVRAALGTMSPVAQGVTLALAFVALLAIAPNLGVPAFIYYQF
ncbi:MBOAT family O-acyltransferase [Rugosimonospora africana]|uniref:MBOAT family O-acyltransferase n=1 Tax=Rugosimonospora africana TaxID=556532 RepID=UPI0019451A30|nr:MBOAT family protein [Rugosimonospora africana]